MSSNITFICPALNEEMILDSTIRDFIKVVEPVFNNFEIIIFNDGSKDNTGDIAEKLSKEFSFVSVVHNKTNKNIGYCFKKGVKQSQYDYVQLICADSYFDKESYELIYKKLGTKDLLIPYIENIKAEKKSYRYALSRAYNFIINKLFGLNLIYHNGLCIFKKSLLKDLPGISNGFFFQVEYATILIRCYKVAYEEIPCRTIVAYREDGEKALSFNNIKDMIISIIKLKKYIFMSKFERN